MGQKTKVFTAFILNLQEENDYDELCKKQKNIRCHCIMVDNAVMLYDNDN